MAIEPPKDKAEQATRLRRVLRNIEKHPEFWKQESWHCGTSHCFAGFAQLFALGLPIAMACDTALNNSAMRDASDWLGLEVETEFDEDFEEDTFIDDGHPLFLGSNTLPDLRRIVASIIADPNSLATPEERT